MNRVSRSFLAAALLAPFAIGACTVVERPPERSVVVTPPPVVQPAPAVVTPAPAIVTPAPTVVVPETRTYRY